MLYYRMIPFLAIIVVGCCLVWALASAFSGPRLGYGGFAPPIFIGPSWSHGGYYHGSPPPIGSGGFSGPTRGPSSGSSGRSPVGSSRGGGVTGGHGGK